MVGSILLSTLALEGCYFFRKRKPGQAGPATSGVIGAPIGQKAGGVDSTLLASVHAITTDQPPAAVRPDPDVMVRRLLLQYREEGSVVAREIGRVEQYRLLLGGASEDFATKPQESYDATSLLAKLKVAEEVCRGLVAPNSTEHPGWETILPASVDDTSSNIVFLVQRIIGIPTSQISDETVSDLGQILDTARENGRYTENSYIPVCAALVIDANALLL